MEVDTNWTDHITTSGATDAPQVTAVVNKKRNPCNKSFKLTLGAWNVRTTNDSDDSIRPERATVIICRELEKAGIDICALSEVRRQEFNTIERSHTIFWSGSLLSQFKMNPKPINDRFSTLRLKLMDGSHLTLISVYGPTMQRAQEEKERFYENLGECVDDAKNDGIIILGDLNARVGKDWLLWPSVLGKHGVGSMNSNGLMLLEFCSRHQLTIMGSMLQLKDSLKTTWQHLRSKHWHQIDHVLANETAMQYITVTKVNTKADCLTDHRLLICKCSFRILRKKNV